mmetsp:Transcript_9838/g.22540  ORF Transcript_9838/g.22540 Transcript_9838/m.22540 type:complete len:348 (-) Transcript_9838:2009-3052(-)
MSSASASTHAPTDTPRRSPLDTAPGATASGATVPTSLAAWAEASLKPRLNPAPGPRWDRSSVARAAQMACGSDPGAWAAAKDCTTSRTVALPLDPRAAWSRAAWSSASKACLALPSSPPQLTARRWVHLAAFLASAPAAGRVMGLGGGALPSPLSTRPQSEAATPRAAKRRKSSGSSESHCRPWSTARNAWRGFPRRAAVSNAAECVVAAFGANFSSCETSRFASAIGSFFKCASPWGSGSAAVGGGSGNFLIFFSFPSSSSAAAAAAAAALVSSSALAALAFSSFSLFFRSACLAFFRSAGDMAASCSSVTWLPLPPSAPSDAAFKRVGSSTSFKYARTAPVRARW